MIEFSKHVKKLLKQAFFIEVLTQTLDFFKHILELSHDETKECNSKKENHCEYRSFNNTHRVIISEPHCR